MKKFLSLLLFCLIPLLALATPSPAPQIFSVAVEKVDPNNFTLKFTIKPNYFLYKDRILLNSDSENIHLGSIRFPPAVKKADKQGHEYLVYRDQIAIPVAILGNKPGEANIDLTYQGCADDGFCYAPENRSIRVMIDKELGIQDISLITNKTPDANDPSMTGKISQLFASNNWFLILFTFYGFGLLLSLTPCILPMVPVLSGIIIGHGKNITTRKAFLLSLSYVLSMSLTYALVGAVVALLGANLQISMQSPWSIGFFSLIFVLLALSMFGFYEFKLPNAWQAKIGSTSRSQRGGHYIGAAIMGCLSTLILSPCVTAPLIGVLTYIAQTKNILLGCLTLFILSLGMGTPLLLIGTSAGKFLPETGSWMNGIKYLFGVIFLAVAIVLISRIAPLSGMILWAGLLVGCGVFVGALTYSVSQMEKFRQTIGLILLAYGLLILVGASQGSTNPLQPLLNTEQVAGIAAQSSQELTLAEIKQRIQAARGTPIMLDFYADWCTSCKVMEATTLKDSAVLQALSNYRVIKIDVTKNNANSKEIMEFFDVVAPPTFIFFSAQGRQLEELNQVGELSASELLAILNKVTSETKIY